MKQALITASQIAVEELIPARPPTSGVTILTVDTAGTVLSVNADFEESAGYSRYAVLGKRIADLGDGRDVHLFRILQTAIQRARTLDGAASHGWEATHDRSAEISVFPVVDSIGRISQFVAIKRDIATLQRERLLIHKVAYLERIGRIVGAFAHHFNNLLTPILGHAELVIARLAEGDAARSSAEMIIRAGVRGASMIRRLISFGQKTILRPEPLDLNALISGMESRIRGGLRGGIEFETHLSPILGQVHADPGQLELLLMDLVANACEAMPGGGRLSIKTTDIEIDRPRFRQGVSIAPGDYAVLSVQDNGVGMDAETRALVFEPFFTTKPWALGLGLSSAYGFVKQTGGYIWVHGQPGKGTSVTLYLPCVPQEYSRTHEELDAAHFEPASIR